jgi:hypothetical protein
MMRKSSAAALVALLIVLFGLLYFLSARKSVDPDVFMMAEVAQQVLDGKRLYADTWDNKAPLSLLFYALPQMIVPHSYAAIQLASFVIALCLALTFWKLLAHEPVALRALAALLPVLLPLQSFAFVWASSEDVTNLFVAFVVLMSYRAVSLERLRIGEMLVAGAALALAVHARQTALLFGALPLLAIIMAREATIGQRARSVVGFGVGGLIGWALVVVLILAVGDFSGYVNTVFIRPLSYQGHYWNAVESFMSFRVNGVALLLFVTTVILVLRSGLRWFFAALALVTVAVVLSPMKSFEHYWAQSIPSLSLMLPMAIKAVTTAREPERPTFIAAIVAFMGLNGLLTCFYLGFVNTSLYWYHLRLESLDQVVAQLDELADEDDRLLAVGHMSVYFHFQTELEPASMYFWHGFMAEYGLELIPADGDEVLDGLRREPPDVIVISEREFWRIQGGGATSDVSPRFDLLLDELIADPAYELHEVDGWMLLKRAGAR